MRWLEPVAVSDACGLGAACGKCGAGPRVPFWAPHRLRILIARTRRCKCAEPDCREGAGRFAPPTPRGIHPSMSAIPFKTVITSAARMTVM